MPSRLDYLNAAGQGVVRFLSLFGLGHAIRSWERSIQKRYGKIDGIPGAHRINTREARRIIETGNLATVESSWHYSWNIEKFFDSMILYERKGYTYLFHTEPYNIVSPAPFFSDDIQVNALISKSDNDLPFWYVKLANFDDFLNRRSEMSRQPGKNFPSRQTYARHARKMECRLERLPLVGNEEILREHYTGWKLRKYNHTADDLIKDVTEFNRRIPRDWLFLYALRGNFENDCKGIFVTVEDGRSASLQNLADAGGFGLFMLVEGIKMFCKMNYISFDCGVTKPIGNYKSAIFLDPIKTTNNTAALFL